MSAGDKDLNSVIVLINFENYTVSSIVVPSGYLSLSGSLYKDSCFIWYYSWHSLGELG